jgi:hypothetical protein
MCVLRRGARRGREKLTIKEICNGIEGRKKKPRV